MGIILKRCLERKAQWEIWSLPAATVVVAGQSVAVAGTEGLVSTLHWRLGTTPRTPFDRGWREARRRRQRDHCCLETGIQLLLG